MKSMHERRSEPRLLCADLVNIEWQDESGRQQKSVANLEDISESGVCLQLEVPIPLHQSIRITFPTGQFSGEVRYCVYRHIGYFIGVQFVPESRWSQRRFKPQHLFDPRRLAKSKTNVPARKAS